MGVVVVHVVAGWQDWLAGGLAAVAGGLIGARAVLLQGRRDAQRSVTAEVERRNEKERAAEQRFQREMLFRGSDRLLQSLWTREREVCAALHVATTEVDKPAKESNAHRLLSELDLQINEDMILALPYLPNVELRARIATAKTVVNDCFNMRAAGAGATADQYNRAKIDVQGYFDWLRWNLVCTLQGDDLPPALDSPTVRDPDRVGTWQNGLRPSCPCASVTRWAANPSSSETATISRRRNRGT